MLASIGLEYRMAGEFDSCVKTSTAPSAMKDGGEVRTDRALCKLGQKDEKGTLDDLQAAVAKEPSYAPGHYYLGGRLAKHKRFKEAAAEYAKYLELAPNGSLAEGRGAARLKAAQDADGGTTRAPPSAEEEMGVELLRILAARGRRPPSSTSPTATRPPVGGRATRGVPGVRAQSISPGDGAAVARVAAPTSVRRATGSARAAARASGRMRAASSSAGVVERARPRRRVKHPDRVRRRDVRCPQRPEPAARSRASART